MKRVTIFLCAAILIVSTVALGQTYTFQGSANLPVNANAGDIVTVTAALSTNDIDEDGEGEPLVVSLPGGTFTVSNYFSNQTTHFLALQDNPIVFAQIVGADGDEVARVTFSTRKMRFTQEQKDHFAQLGIKYGAASLGLATIGGACGLAPEPTITKVCAAGGLLGALVTGGASLYYQRLALDPNDPNFTVIVVPVIPVLPTLDVQPGITQAESDAFNAWIANQAQQSAFAMAIVESINRANSASDAGDTDSEQKQLQAAGNFAITLSSLLGQETGLRQSAVSAIQAAGFPPQTFTANDVFNEEFNILFNGLPPLFSQGLAAEGFGPDDIAFIAGELFVQDPNTLAPNNFPQVLNDPQLNSLEATVAQDLLVFGVNTAGTPLVAGQMVQAQGFVNDVNGGKTTFATESHIDGSGNLVGHLELNDDSLGFSISAGVVNKAVLINNVFAETGTFIASDGSSQTFVVLGDATNQTFSISTSTGFSASGLLGGGNVKIKN